MRKLSLIVASLASFALSGSAAADPVDNPGPFNLSFDSGTLIIGTQVFTITSLTMSGSILNTSGALDVPQGNIVLPDAVIPNPIIGNITLHFQPLQDATGSLNAVTGRTAVLGLSFRVELINPFLPTGCGISPDPLNLTSGTDGALTGVPYSEVNGTVTLVNNSFGVPSSTGCGIFGGAIDNAIGLPSPPGNNELNQLHGTFNPIFTGTSCGQCSNGCCMNNVCHINDPAACGTGGGVCVTCNPPSGGLFCNPGSATCTNGTCGGSCPDPTCSYCAGQNACRNLQSDPHNCGYCGNDCTISTGDICRNGVCVCGHPPCP